MAHRWLRGPQAPGTANYHRTASIIWYHWYVDVLGYELVDEVIAGAYRYSTSTLLSGTDGVLTSSNYQFSSASATFTSGMIGHYVSIVDSGNAVNCGIYRITNFIDANTVEIDYYSPDFPAAATNLTFKTFDAANITGLADNDLSVYRVNHATSPYQFSMKLEVGGYMLYRVAAQTDAWDTDTNAWKAGSALHTKEYRFAATAYPRLYCFADTDGGFCWSVNHNAGGTANKQMHLWGVFNPLFESGRDAKEKVFSFGYSAGQDLDCSRTGDANYAFDYGNVWSENLNRGCYLARWCGWMYWSAASADYFKTSYTLPNSRSGTEYDGLPIWVAGDADVSVNFPVWAMWGALPQSHIWLGSVKGLGELTTFGNDAYIHWRDGVVTPWPGIRRS